MEMWLSKCVSIVVFVLVLFVIQLAAQENEEAEEDPPADEAPPEAEEVKPAIPTTKVPALKAPEPKKKTEGTNLKLRGILKNKKNFTATISKTKDTLTKFKIKMNAISKAKYSGPSSATNTSVTKPVAAKPEDAKPTLKVQVTSKMNAMPTKNNVPTVAVKLSNIQTTVPAKSITKLAVKTTSVPETASKPDAVTKSTRILPEQRGYSLMYTKQSVPKRCKDLTCPSKPVITYKEDGTIKVPTYAGALLEKCGKKFFFLSNPQTKTEIDKLLSKCCVMGAIPARFSSKTELDCVIDRYLALPEKMNSGSNRFLVAGGDYALNRTFVTCPENLPIADEFWANGEPNNDKGVEACVTLRLDKNNGGLLDSFCMAPARYACLFDPEGQT